MVTELSLTADHSLHCFRQALDARERAAALGHDEDGAVMIELALVLPLILLLLFGMIRLVVTVDLAQHVAIGAGAASHYLERATTDQGVSDQALAVARCLVMSGHASTDQRPCDLNIDCAVHVWCGSAAAQSIVVDIVGDASVPIIAVHVDTTSPSNVPAAFPAALPVRARLETLRAGS